MSESFVDQEKDCRDCRNKFMFTAGEQKFYAEKGFTPTNRCKACRDRRKADKASGGGGHPQPAQQQEGPIVMTARRPSYDQPEENRNEGGGRKRHGKQRQDRHDDTDW